MIQCIDAVNQDLISQKNNRQEVKDSNSTSSEFSVTSQAARRANSETPTQDEDKIWLIEFILWTPGACCAAGMEDWIGLDDYDDAVSGLKGEIADLTADKCSCYEGLKDYGCALPEDEDC